ncbi:mammalian cell entry protein [Mycobacterium decipiens]|uniref:Mammalian cell entry protein n=1 Tax=Mycobacterium decipiens TaxID=1430326 RepID=A0A1X2LXT5_9MYCO|nr:mammalian cell entry protein [Mycobacterium decipiens]OSC42014.1 mammalian cell entry protein [Mycobacterium decipiens]
MSPRRKFETGEGPLLVALPIEPPRRWGLPPRPWDLRARLFRLPAALIAAAVVSTAAISSCVFMLITHESHQRAARQDTAMLSDVRSFMAMFTSPDPFHANEYAERVLAHATGQFAQQYRDRHNEILMQISGVEPTTGTVLDAGVERWNDDGSANVLVVTEITSKSPDGKRVVGSANRWVITAKQEGNEWKISNLLPVI